MTVEERYQKCKELKEKWIETGEEHYIVEYLALNRRKVDMPVEVERRSDAGQDKVSG